MNEFVIQISINTVLGLLQVYARNPNSTSAGKFKRALHTLRDALNAAFPPDPPDDKPVER